VARKLCAAGARLYLVVRHGGRARDVFERYSIQGEVIEADLSSEPAPDGIYRRMIRR
jgi:hypothetical protein